MKKILLTFCIICSLLSSCTTRKKMAIECINQLSERLVNDKSSIVDIYPLSSNFSSTYKSDNFTIKKITKLKDKKFSILVNSSYTNAFNRSFHRDIVFYLAPVENSSKYYIYDSEGFCANYNLDDADYLFAIKTGCIDPKSDKTDQEIAKKCEIATYIYIQECFIAYCKIQSKLQIKDWYWEYSYGSAHGKGICVNDSDFAISKPKYIITYKDNKGNPITKDEGYITYGVLAPGASKAFSFYTGYIGHATKASIETSYDTSYISEYILNDKEYTGNEYNEVLAEYQKHQELIEEQ